MWLLTSLVNVSLHLLTTKDGAFSVIVPSGLHASPREEWWMNERQARKKPMGVQVHIKLGV